MTAGTLWVVIASCCVDGQSLAPEAIKGGTVLDRFSGTEGREALVEALMRQRIIENDRPVAESLAGNGTLVGFAPGDTVIAQNATDTDVFFILSGEVTVYVNHREVATRGAREAIGEMVAVDMTARRSATLKAKTPVLCLKVSAAHFVAAGEGSARFWRAIAQVVADRLRERARFHRPANEVPIMFMGSSTEGLPVVAEIECALKHEKGLVLHPWSRDVFGPSRSALDDLLAEARIADFALFVFGPDDKVASRGTVEDAPRDNVIYEMGLFTGRLGRERVFMLKEHSTDLKIPSDLVGNSPITYVVKKGANLAHAIGPAVVEIKKAVTDLGAV